MASNSALKNSVIKKMALERKDLAYVATTLFDLPDHNVQIFLQTLHRQTTKEVKRGQNK